MSQRTRDTFRSIQSFLRRQTTLVLATADDGAKPRSTPLFFIADDQLRMYWFSSPNSRHSRNCARHPRVSVAVFRNTRRWQEIRGAQMDGRVSVVADRTLRRELTRKYCIRFRLDGNFETAIRRSVLYCFTPARARYLDNSRKFGNKFELCLSSDAAKASSSSSSSRRNSGTASARRAPPCAG